LLLVITPALGRPLIFHVPERIEYGYSADIKAYAAHGQTHPTFHTWTGGALADMSLELQLVAGIGYKIATADDLVDRVQELVDLALPDSIWVLRSVRVSIRGRHSGSWFNKRFFVKGVTPTFTAPFDIDSGRPMAATVKLTLVPTTARETFTRSAIELRKPFTFAEG
jgi:hypothetical protein